MGLLDDIFEELTTEKEQEIPSAQNPEKQIQEEPGEDDSAGEKPSPLFPSGDAWKKFKEEHGKRT